MSDSTTDSNTPSMWSSIGSYVSSAGTKLKNAVSSSIPSTDTSNQTSSPPATPPPTPEPIPPTIPTPDDTQKTPPVEDIANEDPITRTINYVKNIIKAIFYVALFVILGATMLYTCRVASAELLLSDVEHFPYSKDTTDIPPKTVEVNRVVKGDETLSTALNFNFDNNYFTDIDDNKKNNLIVGFVNWMTNKIDENDANDENTKLYSFFLKSIRESIRYNIFIQISTINRVL